MESDRQIPRQCDAPPMQKRGDIGTEKSMKLQIGQYPSIKYDLTEYVSHVPSQLRGGTLAVCKWTDMINKLVRASSEKAILSIAYQGTNQNRHVNIARRPRSALVKMREE